MARHPRGLERLQRSPGLGLGNGDGMHLWLSRIRIKKPLRRIALFKRHKFKRDREMNVIEIEVVELQVLQRALGRRANMLGPMVGVPKLRRDPQIFAAT
ncbi:hypothetical protein DSM3645_15890 [Blastopirellula marina DSM 3645]|uniref:Uncharacterized protein n=1 Tax=Blastopirellula marina DSM 3645 TaxID=314230 RepID=A4A285_9BACT|nr:hypothetical protein DSM3645_15890 [Blastopirellula marina DSM 3645]